MITDSRRLLRAKNPCKTFHVMTDPIKGGSIRMFSRTVFECGSEMIAMAAPPMMQSESALKKIDRFTQIAKLISKFYRAEEKFSWMDLQMSEAEKRMQQADQDLIDMWSGIPRERFNYIPNNNGLRLDAIKCFWLPPNILGT